MKVAEADLARLDPAINGVVPFVRCTTLGQPEDSRILVVFDGKQLSRALESLTEHGRRAASKVMPPLVEVTDAYVDLRTWCVQTGHGLGAKDHEADRWVAAVAGCTRNDSQLRRRRTQS